MVSEIRVDKINSLSGVGTVTLSPTGVDIAGITTAATLRATTGIVTSLTAGSLTSLGAVSGTTGTFSGAVSGTTGTFTGDVDIADKIIHTGDTDTTIRFPSADTIRFDTGGTEAARINSSQKLIIGDTNSDAQLGVYRASYNLAEFTNTNADATGAEVALRKDSSSPADGDVLGMLKFIGDNDAGQKVNYAYIQSKSSDVTDSTEDGRLEFYTRGAGTLGERLRIDSSGRVLIGTTNVGGGNADDLTIATSGNTGITIRSGTSNTGNIFWSDATSGADQYIGALEYHHSDNQFKFNISNTTRMTVDSTGDVTVSDGDLVIGTSGHGIDFSATGGGDLGGSGTSELLDDYEEGTCTFTFVPASGSYGAVYTTGHYTKIGDIVHVTGSISINGATNASGEVQISGLPFSVRGVNSTWSGEGGHGTGRWFYGGPNHFVHLVCNNSTDKIQVHKADGTFLNHTDMNTSYNASQYSFTATYFHA